MKIREIEDKNKWEDFFLKIREKTFLQSWGWGDFQKEMGNKIWRLGIFDENEIISAFLTVKIKAKRGTFLLIQHGPCIKEKRSEALSLLLEKLKEIGKKEKASFVRMNPLWEEESEVLKKLGFVASPIQENAYESTLKLDLSLSEEELLKKMRKTTRYLIRQTLKNKDITIEKESKNISEFQVLNEKIGKRQGFIPFSSRHVEKEFEVFSKNNECLLLLGKYKGETAAGALVVFWSNMAFYHLAASEKKFNKLSVPYLLQWEAIKEAKKRGCLFYDFWGYIDPKKYPKHPWAGPTLFKLGYSGKAFQYLKSHDYPFSKKYWLTYAFEFLRRIKRKI